MAPAPRGRGARAPRPAPDDDDARVDAVDDLCAAGTGVNEREKVTTQKFVQQLVGASAGVLLAEDVEKRCARGAQAQAVNDEHSDTESESSEGERDERCAMQPLHLPPATVDEVMSAMRRAEAMNAANVGTAEKSFVINEQQAYVSASLTTSRRAGTVLLTPPELGTRCQRCDDVAAEPMKNAEGRLFCGPCGRWKEGSDRAALFGVDVQTQMKIDDMAVMCCHSVVAHVNGRNGVALDWKIVSDGCREVHRLAQIRSHEETCARALVRCGLPTQSSNRAEKCHDVFPRGAVEAHRAKCHFRIQNCNDCGCGIQVRKFRAHSLVCGAIEVFCPYRRCKWRGKRGMVDAHVATECLAHPVMCRLEDSETRDICMEIVPRERIGEHKISCQYQMRPCEYCGHEVSLRRMGAHKLKCESRDFQCHRCGRVMPNEHRDLHVREQCPMSEANCEHNRFGCEAKVSKEAYRQHAIDYLDAHIRQVTFGPDGVVHFVETPGKDEVNALALLRRMQTHRIEMMDDFSKFDELCASLVTKIATRAAVAMASTPSTIEVMSVVEEFRSRSNSARRVAEFNLLEKSAFDRDEVYHDLLVSRNLAGAHMLEELRDLDERTSSLHQKIEMLYVSLESRRDDAVNRLDNHLDDMSPASTFVADAKLRVHEFVKAKREDRRRLDAKVLDAKSAVANVKNIIVDNAAHRKRTGEKLERDILASLSARDL